MSVIAKAMKDLEYLSTISSEELTQARRVFVDLLGTALSGQGKNKYKDILLRIDEELYKRDM